MGLLGASDLDITFAIIGGLLMCIATSFNLWSKGRITGNSGYLANLLKFDKPTIHFRFAFLFGIWVASTMMFLIVKFHKINNQSWFFDTPSEMIKGLSLPGFAIAGLLVGYGTVLGNGCTSGHGVCGLPRFSIRSFVAVGCFMMLGVGIGTLRYHVPFLDNTQAVEAVEDVNLTLSNGIFLGIGIIGFVLLTIIYRTSVTKMQDILITFFVAFIFGMGLVVSGMCRRTKILAFLSISKNWDPSLIFVMLAAVAGNIFTFHYIIKIKKQPQYAEKFGFPAHQTPVTWQLIVGECLFGLGWGIGGVCPGPVIALFPFLSIHVSVCFWATLIIGIYLAQFTNKVLEKKNIEQQPLLKK